MGMAPSVTLRARLVRQKHAYLSKKCVRAFSDFKVAPPAPGDERKKFNKSSSTLTLLFGFANDPLCIFFCMTRQSMKFCHNRTLVTSRTSHIVLQGFGSGKRMRLNRHRDRFASGTGGLSTAALLHFGISARLSIHEIRWFYQSMTPL